MSHLQFFLQHMCLIYGVIFEMLALTCIRGVFDTRDNFWMGMSITSMLLGLFLMNA